MNQDTLHQINDIYIALEQLKNQVKPIEKSFIEKYGILIVAAIPIVLFYLTKRKEAVKEDKQARSKLFSDLMEVHYDFIESVKERDLKIVDVKYYDNLIARVQVDKEVKDGWIEIQANNQEQLKNLQIQLDKYRKVYFAKVSNYIFFKDQKTKILLVQKDMRAIGLKFKPDEYDSSELAYCKEYHKLQAWKCQTFWSEKILQPSGLIIDAILKNE